MKGILSFLKKAVNVVEGRKKKRKLIMVYAIDMSGSMADTEKDMMPAYDEYQKYRAGVHPDTAVITVLFNHSVVCVCDGKKVSAVPKLKYQPSGSTAMFDGFAFAIRKTLEWKKKPDNEFADADVLYTFKTDGYENSSLYNSAETVRSLVQSTLKDTANGKSSYIILNEFCINGVELAQNLGLGVENVQMFFRDKGGIECVFKAIDIAIDIVADTGAIEGTEWKEQSDKITYGRMTLGEIDKSTEELRNTLDFNEREIARFEKLAEEEGLTSEFEKDYLAFLESLDKLNELKKKFKGTLFAELAEAGVKRQVRDGRNIMKFALNKEIKKRVAENTERAELFKSMYNEVPTQKKFEAAVQDFQNCLSGINRLIEDTLTKYKFFTSANISRTGAVIRAQEALYTEIINDFFSAHKDLVKLSLGASNTTLYGSQNPSEERKVNFLERKMATAPNDVVECLKTAISGYEFWTYCAETKQRSFSQYTAFDAFRREYIVLQRWFTQLDKNLKHCGINSVNELLAMSPSSAS